MEPTERTSSSVVGGPSGTTFSKSELKSELDKSTRYTRSQCAQLRGSGSRSWPVPQPTPLSFVRDSSPHEPSFSGHGRGYDLKFVTGRQPQSALPIWQGERFEKHEAPLCCSHLWIPDTKPPADEKLDLNTESSQCSKNWDLREAHPKSVNKMEELKRFQGSTFDTIARRRLVEDQDTILELTGKIQELQSEINCMND